MTILSMRSRHGLLTAVEGALEGLHRVEASQGIAMRSRQALGLRVEVRLEYVESYIGLLTAVHVVLQDLQSP